MEEPPSAGKRACNEFYYGASGQTEFIPDTINPYAIPNIGDTDKDILVEAIQAVDKKTMLILVLGESLDSPKENEVKKTLFQEPDIFTQEFVQTFPGKKSILIIDPGHTLSEGKKIEPCKIHEELLEKNVVSILLVKASFPLTPIFGPHKTVYYGSRRNVVGAEAFTEFLLEDQPNSLKAAKKGLYGFLAPLRRKVYGNAVDVLEELVAFPERLMISSRIQKVCYRSFKYLIDIRALLGRETKAFYGRTGQVGIECVTAQEFPLFPGAFRKCRELYASNEQKRNAHLDKYYYLAPSPKSRKRNNVSARLMSFIEPMNEWANAELEKRRQAVRRNLPKGGKRKTRKRKY